MNTQWLLMDLEGKVLTTEEIELLQHPSIAGVILFTRNYDSPEQLKDLTHHIKQISQELIIAVDQEGGRVQRFRDGFTILPAMQYWGELYDKNPEQAKSELSSMTTTQLKELQSVGVDITLVPVLDINHDLNSVIGDRSLHHKPDVVIELANTIISNLHEHHMPAIGKHFPGHGGVAGDSHKELPVDQRDKATIWRNDLRPFAKLCSQLDAVMPAHVIYEQLDPTPAGFSKFWLQQVLREELHFDGIVITDDLSMAGAAAMGSYADRASLALEAGCDLLEACNNRQGIIEILDNIKDYRNSVSQERVKKFISLSLRS